MSVVAAPSISSTTGAESDVGGQQRRDRDAEHRHAMTTTTPDPASARLDAAATAASGDDGSLVPHPESESNPVDTAVRRVVSDDRSGRASSTVSSSSAHEE